MFLTAPESHKPALVDARSDTSGRYTASQKSIADLLPPPPAIMVAIWMARPTPGCQHIEADSSKATSGQRNNAVQQHTFKVAVAIAPLLHAYRGPLSFTHDGTRGAEIEV